MAACCSSRQVVVLGGLDDLVRDVPAGRHHDDQHLAAVERHEIQVLERGRVGRRRDREPDLMRRARDFLRDVRQQVVDGARAAQPRLDLRRRSASVRRSASS